MTIRERGINAQHRAIGTALAMWQIDTDSSAVVSAISARNQASENDDVIGQGHVNRTTGTAGVDVVNTETRVARGLFRQFSLKVIEWIRKSLELGRNEVCELCL